MHDIYNYTDCRTVIRVSPGSRIHVNFLEFNTENYFDCLEVIFLLLQMNEST